MQRKFSVIRRGQLCKKCESSTPESLGWLLEARNQLLELRIGVIKTP